MTEEEMGDNIVTLPFNYSLLFVDQVETDNFTLKSQYDDLMKISGVEETAVDNRKANFGDFLVQTGLSGKSAVINLRVLVFLILNLKKEWSSIGFLMLHHIALILISNGYDVIRTAIQCQLILIKGPAMLCGIWKFFEDLIYAMIQLDAILIVYERVRAAKIEWSSREEKSASEFSPKIKDFKVYRNILFMWFLALLGSWPWSYFGFVGNFLTGTCLKDFLPEDEVAYQIFRFVCFHLLVCNQLVWVLYTVRSRVNHSLYICPIRNRKKRFREHILRFAYLTTIFSLVLLLPAGILRGTFKLLSSGLFGEFQNGLNSRLIWVDRMASFLNSIYYIIYPLIYVCVHEDMLVTNGLGCGWIKEFLVRFALKFLDGADAEEKENSESEEIRPPPAVRPTTLAVVEDMEFFDIGGNKIHRKKDVVAKAAQSSLWTVPVIVETLVKDLPAREVGTRV